MATKKAVWIDDENFEYLIRQAASLQIKLKKNITPTDVIHEMRKKLKAK